MIALIAFVPIAFIAGSIPTGLLIARSRGLDIRAHGSGNIGATNVWRVMGWRFGLPCFLLDVLKGFAPVLAAGVVAGVAPRAWTPAPIAAADAGLWLAVVAAAILGHMFTPWAGFKGGKGVATALGAALGVWPYLTVPALAALALWGLVLAVSRMVSVASCAAMIAVPVLVYLWSALSADDRAHRGAWPFVLIAAAVGVLVVVRHRSNLARVWRGTENRIGGRPRPAAPGPGPSR